MVPPDTLLRALQRALGDPSPGVRRVAVALFTRLPAEEALPELVSALRSDEDAAVLQAVAAQAQGAFENFARLAGSIDRESSDAITLTRLAQFVHHAGLAELIAPLASSSAPAVREAVAELWMARPDLADSAALARLVRDPVSAVRRAAAGAAAAAGQPDAILPLAEDPDPVVRRDLALLLHGTLNIPLPSSLRQDPDESVRAAAAVSSLLRGEATRLPAGVSREAAAVAVSDLARTEDLRGVARTAPDPVHRLAAALALALVGDPVAHQVAAHDPLPSVRDQVAAMLRGERA
jgi:HEAT repeat protein